MSDSENPLKNLEHETLIIRRGRRSGLYGLVAIHSTVRGPALGGCRMLSYPDVSFAAKDVLRLAQAMTFKSAVANLPLGGGKGVIMLPPGTNELSDDRRRDALLDFGDIVESLDGTYITAEDVGTSETDMLAISERTNHVVGLGLDRGGSGDPGPWTALGVATAIKVACEEVWGTGSLSERTIAVVGMGHVGSRLAPLLAEQGARLILSDIDDRKRHFARELDASWIEADEAMNAKVDLLAPCALGAVLNRETVPKLRCRVVTGAANNQLASDDVADLLAERGILWTPDFVANAGGIINISAEVLPEGYNAEVARDRVEHIAVTLREVFASANQLGITPLEASMRVASERLRPTESIGSQHRSTF